MSGFVTVLQKQFEIEKKKTEIKLQTADKLQEPMKCFSKVLGHHNLFQLLFMHKHVTSVLEIIR